MVHLDLMVMLLHVPEVLLYPKPVVLYVHLLVFLLMVTVLDRVLLLLLYQEVYALLHVILVTVLILHSLLVQMLVTISPQTCVQTCVVAAPLFGVMGSCSSSMAAGTSCSLICNVGYTISTTWTTCSFTAGVLAIQTCGTQNLGSTSWSTSVGNYVNSLATDSFGNLYGPLYTTGTISRWNALSTLTTQVQSTWYSGTISAPWGVCFDQQYQYLYVTSNSLNTITHIPLIPYTLLSGTASIWSPSLPA